MIRNVLQSIDGVSIYPIISFMIFFVFFIVLLTYVFTMDKRYVKAMKDMPLSDAQPSVQSSSSIH